ncbi:MAG: tRNA pseudouridine(55) synthase TruB [Microthrixaceae bacterium]
MGSPERGGRPGRRRPDSGAMGVAVLDKDAGWTSHDVVAKVRGILATRRVGQSGTLDPDATGVLVVGVGPYTKLLRFLQVLPKRYECEIVFGIETETLDAAGTVVATHEMEVDEAELGSEVRRLTGPIEQVPPMVSAVKIDGRRLHELARKGVEVDRPPRPVEVYRFEVTPTDEPLIWRASVECSSGTYVRVLAADLGKALGGGAHLRALRRLSVGGFGLDDACTLDTLGPDRLLTGAAAVPGFPLARVDDVAARAVGQGAVLDADDLGVAGHGPWPVIGPDGELLAVYELFDRGDGGRRVKPALVLGRA